MSKDKKYGYSGKCEEKYEVTFEEEKSKVDSSKLCDLANTDYQWASCGIDRKIKESEEK